MSMNADNTDDIALLTNTPDQAESLLHCLERAAGGIDLHVNAKKKKQKKPQRKTEFMCFIQRGDISTLNRGSLKLVEKFTYLGSIVTSIEKDINLRLAKA